METIFERECLCRYLHTLTRESGLSLKDLADKTGKSAAQLQAIFDGQLSPSLDDLILIGNLVGMKITINPSFSFAHKKIVTLIRASH